jgi:hypothetical protein
MPTFRITAPDGRKFDISGEGSKEQALAHFQQLYQSKTKQGFMLREPGEYDTESKEYADRYGPTSGSSGLRNFREGMGSQFMGRGRQLGNIVGTVSDEAVQAQQQTDAPLKATTGGFLGGLATDLALSVPFGGTIAGGTAAGVALGATDPNVDPTDGTSRLKSTAIGGGFGLGGSVLAKVGANAIANRTARAALSKARAKPMLETLEGGQKLGLVVPPSTTNPTWWNRMIESLGGKEAVEQEAALLNAEKMQNAARRFLGLSEDAPMNLETLGKLRGQNSGAYREVVELVDKVGGVGGDIKYVDELNAILQKYGGAHRFGKILPQHRAIDELITELKRPPFSGNEAMQLVKDLRLEAGKSFATRAKSLGKAQRAAADAIEGAIERNISRYPGQLGQGAVGKQYASQVLDAWRKARVSDAKTYAVEGIINRATGNIQGAKLARSLAKGAPLTGELKDMAKFVSAFTSTGKEPTRSAGVNALTTLFATESALLGHPEGLALPFARTLTSKALTSKLYQRLGTVPRFKPKTRIPKLARRLGKAAPAVALNYDEDDDG